MSAAISEKEKADAQKVINSVGQDDGGSQEVSKGVSTDAVSAVHVNFSNGAQNKTDLTVARGQ